MAFDNIEWINTALAPVMIAVIGVLGRVYLARMNRRMREIIQYFEIERSNGDYIQKLHQIKHHYLTERVPERFRHLAHQVADRFIGTVVAILENYTIDLAAWPNIRADLDNFESCRRERLSIPGANHGSVEYRVLLEAVETALADTDNHYKERFMKACSVYLRDYLSHFTGAGVSSERSRH